MAAKRKPPRARRLEHGTAWVTLLHDGMYVRRATGDTRQPDVRDVEDLWKPGVAEARRFYERLTNDYAARGFEIVAEGAGAIPAPRICVDPALEAQCIASPDAAGPWAVYVDHLLTEGDARAEIAALAADDRYPRAELLVRETGLLGGPTVTKAVTDMRWRFGFLRGATLAHPPAGGSEKLADLASELLAMPLSRFVDDLRFALRRGEDWRPIVDAVAASVQAPWMRALRFDGAVRTDAELVDDFADVWPRLPTLATIVIASSAGGERMLTRARGAADD